MIFRQVLPLNSKNNRDFNVRRLAAAVTLFLISFGVAESPLHASTSDSDLKKALLSGTQIKAPSSDCHATGLIGFLDVATGPDTWSRVNDILGWSPAPNCGPGAVRPWTIGSVPKGAILRWTVWHPSFNNRHSSNPLVVYAGPDPIPASGFFELKSGCYQRGLSANLEWKKSDGTWSIVSDAKGWDEVSVCPSSVPVRPWTATLMTLSPGTQYRWNIYFPGIWSLYSETETIPFPPTTTTTSTITPQRSASEKVVTCQSKTSKIRVIGKNPKCPSGFKTVKKP